MKRNNVTVQEVVDLLNDAVGLDPVAVASLVNQRVPCNDRLDSHDSIQVSPQQTVGLLGVLNGLFGTDEKGYGAIAMEVTTGEVGENLVQLPHFVARDGWQ